MILDCKSTKKYMITQAKIMLTGTKTKKLAEKMLFFYKNVCSFGKL